MFDLSETVACDKIYLLEHSTFTRFYLIIKKNNTQTKCNSFEWMQAITISRFKRWLQWANE